MMVNTLDSALKPTRGEPGTGGLDPLHLTLRGLARRVYGLAKDERGVEVEERRSVSQQIAQLSDRVGEHRALDLVRWLENLHGRLDALPVRAADGAMPEGLLINC